MFELHVADTDITSGSLTVSWCVDIELLKNLAEKNVKDPMVVIVTAPANENDYHNSKELRQVVPLKDLIAYITFKSSGHQKVWAFISVLGEKKAKNTYLAREDGVYRTDILNHDGQDFSNWIYGTNDKYQLPSLDVDVPDTFFAAPPANWEKAWVNAFFEGKATDQCNFRRRRLFSYTVQPLIMLVSIVFRTVLTLISFFALGLRAATPKYIFHPLTYNLLETFEVFNLLKGTYFIRQNIDNDQPYALYLLKKFWSFPFMPVICVPIWVMWYKHILLQISIMAIVFIVFATFISFFASGTAKGVLNSLYDWFDKRNYLGKAWYLNQEGMNLILCSKNNKARTLSSLPSKKKTMRLRYFDLKSKICKPFSV